jgi:arginine-tRNA-protein transferase
VKQPTIERTNALLQAIEESDLQPGPPHPCNYLPGREARSLAFFAQELEPGVYHALLDLNFRRCGSMFYRPVCAHCHQCQNIRVPVDDFEPNRAQSRCAKRNHDIAVTVGEPRATKEKHRLYQRYLRLRHDREFDDSWQEYYDFLYDSPLNTIETVYRLDGRLVGVGISDVEPEAMSAVYCYFDTDLDARSLGVFNVLWLIEQCRRERMPHLYLGFYVRDCRKMNYKITYQPCELLQPDGTWRRVCRYADRNCL